MGKSSWHQTNDGYDPELAEQTNGKATETEAVMQAKKE